MTRHAAVITTQPWSHTFKSELDNEGETVMNSSNGGLRSRAASHRRPYEDSFFAAKVDGIMRIAGFVRGQDGNWQKPAIAAGTVSAAAEAASPDLSTGS
jgi:hypothetical protein